MKFRYKMAELDIISDYLGSNVASKIPVDYTLKKESVYLSVRFFTYILSVHLNGISLEFNFGNTKLKLELRLNKNSQPLSRYFCYKYIYLCNVKTE